MGRTTKQIVYFLTVGFYNEHDEYQPRLLRGYHSKAYAQAVCDRLMKYWTDFNKWEAACRKYVSAHPELSGMSYLNIAYPATWRKLEKEWKDANPFSTTAKRHDNHYFITEAPIKATTLYRLYEDADEYGYEDNVTITCMWNLEDAEAFKEEYNRYANEREEWLQESFEYARTNLEFKEKQRQCQEIEKKLGTMDKADSAYEAVESRWYELLDLVSNMLDNLSSMWKAENPFTTTAEAKSGKCFIEPLTIQ